MSVMGGKQTLLDNRKCRWTASDQAAHAEPRDSSHHGKCANDGPKSERLFTLVETDRPTGFGDITDQEGHRNIDRAEKRDRDGGNGHRNMMATPTIPRNVRNGWKSDILIETVVRYA
jgi:hypothetical protein